MSLVGATSEIDQDGERLALIVYYRDDPMLCELHSEIGETVARADALRETLRQQGRRDGEAE